MSKYAPLEAALRKVKEDASALLDDMSRQEKALALDSITHIGMAALGFETLALMNGEEAPKPKDLPHNRNS